MEAHELIADLKSVEEEVAKTIAEAQQKREEALAKAKQEAAQAIQTARDGCEAIQTALYAENKKKIKKERDGILSKGAKEREKLVEAGRKNVDSTSAFLMELILKQSL